MGIRDARYAICDMGYAMCDVDNIIGNSELGIRNLNLFDNYHLVFLISCRGGSLM
jgi:hypothetical protein